MAAQESGNARRAESEDRAQTSYKMQRVATGCNGVQRALWNSLPTGAEAHHWAGGKGADSERSGGDG